MHPRKRRGRGLPSAPPTSAPPLLDQLYLNSGVAASGTESHPPGVQSPEPNSAERQIETAQSSASTLAYCTPPQTLPLLPHPVQALRF